MGGCLVFGGSGVLVRVRRDPHGDDEGVYSTPSPARTRRRLLATLDHATGAALSQERVAYKSNAIPGPRADLWRWSTRPCSLPMTHAQPQALTAWIRGH